MQGDENETSNNYELPKIPKDANFVDGFKMANASVCNTRDSDVQNEKCLFNLTTHNWQNWKRVFLSFHCHDIYKVQAVSLKNPIILLKITIL